MNALSKCLVACLAACGIVAAGFHDPARGQSQGTSSPSRKSSGASRQARPGARAARVTGQPRGPAGDATGSGSTFALDAADAEWTVSITNSAEIQILHRGVEVIKSENLYWVHGSEWAGPSIRVSARAPGQVTLGGKVEKLGLEIRGVARPVAPNELRLDLEIDAARPMTEITGGGLTWRLKLDSSTFTGKPGEPRLLLDKTGWRWPLGGGQEISVQYDQPVARLFFERNQKNQIRTNFIGDRIKPGSARVGLTVRLPDGGRIVGRDEERYKPADRTWFEGALAWDASPVDLSYLNAAEKPAGRRGFVKAEGDRLVFEDGTPARFWGANLSGPPLFSTPRENVARQAKRMSKLGYNLVRIVQHEADWVKPNIFGTDYRDTRHLDRQAFEALDWWIKCLKDEGIYVWLDLHYRRPLKPGDPVRTGRDEIDRKQGQLWGFSFLNPEIAELMKEFQHQYLSHVNRYTKLAYKDDPAVMGVLITNENDLTFHFGIYFLGDKNNPVHKSLFDREVGDFARATGLPAAKLGRTWEPGPNKLLLNDLEYRFFRTMIDDLRSMGLRSPIATTSLWGKNTLYSLPSLTAGDVIDVHSYGASESLSTDPHYKHNLIAGVAAAHVHDKPLTITEWNVHYPEPDRFTTPLYMASIAALQGWDAPMIYNYSQSVLQQPGPTEYSLRISQWSTYYDPAITGVMPAAAVAFRQGHVSPARKNYCLSLSPKQLFELNLTPESTPAIRTLVEQSKLTIGMPGVPELPWLKPSSISGDVTVINDPNQDFLPGAETVVRSDTGELARDWKAGTQTIDTPRTQAVSGWIGGRRFHLKDASFEFSTEKAVVALTSIDNEPLANSRFILITSVGQARPSPATDRGKPVPNRPAGHLPFLSEPIKGTITLKTQAQGLELLALGANGRVVGRTTPPVEQGAVMFRLPHGRGTHWYVLKAKTGAAGPSLGEGEEPAASP